MFPTIKLHTALYLSIFFISIHHVFVYLTNSTVLKVLFNMKTAEILSVYGIASTLGLLFFLYSIGKIKSVKKTLLKASFIEFICLLIMYFMTEAGTSYKFLFIVVFFIHHFITPYILFNLDILFESYTHIDERGKGRGFYSTMWNLPFVFVPLILTRLSLENDINYVYILSAFMLLPFVFVIYKYIQDIKYISNDIKINFNISLKKFWNDKLDRKSFITQFLLHFYYGLTIILLPLYLINVFNYDFNTIGIILAVSLSPFILIQIPFGKIEDKLHNEKMIFNTGIFIVIFFTFIGLFIDNDIASDNIIFYLIMLFLFMTRVGCSLIEIASESLFYKHVNERDEFALLAFRSARLMPHILGLLALFFI